MVRKNDEISLYIYDTTTEGSGVSDINGYKVFVIDAVTGDYLKAHIIKVKKNYAVAVIKELIKPSEYRTNPECNLSSRCGGCCFDNIEYQQELSIKTNQIINNFKKIAGFEITPLPIIPSPEIYRYRNKAQFPVNINTVSEIGFYAVKSHRIIDSNDCKLHPKEFSEIIALFREWLSENELDRYIGKNKSTDIKHIYIRKAFATGQIMVCLVSTSPEIPFVDSLVHKLTQKFQNIKSIQININSENTNVILGKNCLTVYGSEYITDILCNTKFNISPLSFYQINHDCTEILYNKVKEFAELSTKDTLLDLYCGTGTIGLTLANSVKKVIGIEIIEDAVKNARDNAIINNIHNAEFFCSDALNFSDYLLNKNIFPNVIIIDPPRKGCDDSVIQSISKIRPSRIIYVSCDNATMARDCKALKSNGYSISKIQPVDMFPRTGNVETVALLQPY